MSDAPAAKSGVAPLTAREQEVIVNVLHSLKDREIQIDYDQLAKKLGLKGRNSAAAVWSSVKKKLFAGSTTTAADDGGNAGRAPRTPRTPRVTNQLNTPKAPKSAKKAAKSSAPVKPWEREVGKSETEKNVEGTEKDNDGDSPMGGKDTDEKAASPFTLTPEGKDQGDEPGPPVNRNGCGASTPADSTEKPGPRPRERSKAPSPKTPSPSSNETPAPTNPPATPTTIPRKKRGRKSKAEKEAEATAEATATSPPAEVADDEGENEKPAKKPRATPVKKQQKGEINGSAKNEEVAESQGKKPSVTRKSNAKADKDSKGEQDAAELKARREKEAAEANEVLMGKKIGAVTKSQTSPAPEDKTSEVGVEIPKWGSGTMNEEEQTDPATWCAKSIDDDDNDHNHSDVNGSKISEKIDDDTIIVVS